MKLLPSIIAQNYATIFPEENEKRLYGEDNGKIRRTGFG